MNKKQQKTFASIFTAIVVVVGFGFNQAYENLDIPFINNIGEMVGLSKPINLTTDNLRVTSDDIPEYTGTKNIILNDNKSELNKDSFYESDKFYLSNIDNLNRVGVAKSKLLPSEYKGSEDRKTDSAISAIHPTGWKQKRVDGSYIYNRSHLIGYAMTTAGEVDVIPNLMTGTRDFNASSDWGMWKYEKLVQDAVKSGKTVYYEVNPVFKGDELVGRGVQMRAWATDDSLDYNVFIYNVQDNITINYQTGAVKAK